MDPYVDPLRGWGRDTTNQLERLQRSTVKNYFKAAVDEIDSSYKAYVVACFRYMTKAEKAKFTFLKDSLDKDAIEYETKISELIASRISLDHLKLEVKEIVRELKRQWWTIRGQIENEPIHKKDTNKLYEILYRESYKNYLEEAKVEIDAGIEGKRIKWNIAKNDDRLTAMKRDLDYRADTCREQLPEIARRPCSLNSKRHAVEKMVRELKRVAEEIKREMKTKMRRPPSPDMFAESETEETSSSDSELEPVAELEPDEISASDSESKPQVSYRSRTKRYSRK